MAQRKQAYLKELSRIQERVNELFEQTLLGSGYQPADDHPPGTWVPAVDVVEDDDCYLLYVELPGVDRSEIDLRVTSRGLELAGNRRPTEEGQNFLRMERNYGPFRRIIELGGEVDAEGITAEFRRGTLSITVPKTSRTSVVTIDEEGGGD